jgi:ribosomal protein S27AE
MNNYIIDWDKYPNLGWECPNCGNHEDLDFILSERLIEWTPSELKEFILDEESFDINQYCGVCSHTYWIDGKAKEDLDKLIQDCLEG